MRSIAIPKEHIEEIAAARIIAVETITAAQLTIGEARKQFWLKVAKSFPEYPELVGSNTQISDDCTRLMVEDEPAVIYQLMIENKKQKEKT